jgi:hypothetical protein
VEPEIVFVPSAFKHGVTEEDIRHAFKIRLFDHPIPGEENKNLLIGVSRSGLALEVLYNELEPQPISQGEGSPFFTP